MGTSLHKQKSFKKTASVSFGIPGPILALLIALLCGLLYMEYDTHYVSKNFNKSGNMVAGWMQSIQKAFTTEKPKPTEDTFTSGFDITPEPTQDTPPAVVTVTSESTVNIKKEVNVVVPTIAIKYKYVYPTYSYPTIKPGDPGSKEWNDEFWKKFEEMGKQNAASQKAVEEAQRKFCEENPELCNR